MAQTKLGTGFIGEGGKKKSLAAPGAVKSMGHLVALVQHRGLEPELEKAVLKVVTGYPDGSLEYAYNNLDNTIFRCQQALALRPAPTPVEEPKEALKPSKKWRTGTIDDIFDQE